MWGRRLRHCSPFSDSLLIKRLQIDSKNKNEMHIDVILYKTAVNLWKMHLMFVKTSDSVPPHRLVDRYKKWNGGTDLFRLWSASGGRNRTESMLTVTFWRRSVWQLNWSFTLQIKEKHLRKQRNRTNNNLAADRDFGRLYEEKLQNSSRVSTRLIPEEAEHSVSRHL